MFYYIERLVWLRFVKTIQITICLFCNIFYIFLNMIHKFTLSFGFQFLFTIKFYLW